MKNKDNGDFEMVTEIDISSNFIAINDLMKSCTAISSA